MKRVLPVLAAVISLVVAGCSGGGSEVEAIYTLSALDQPQVGSGTGAQLLVPEPRALDALATAKIAVKPSPLTLAYYPAVVYQDTAPKVLQRVLLDTFANTGKVRAVGLPGQSLLINYQIVTEIRAFQAETFAGDRARITVAVKLLDDSSGRVVKDGVFDAIVPLTGDGADVAAAGLNAAVQAVSVDIVEWTLRTI